MYLFHPRRDLPDDDPFIASNGGDEADVVYHEYTHGLSNRLVVDAHGDSTLGGIQAGSMGEAWSDWYAMDYLVSQGLFRDTGRRRRPAGRQVRRRRPATSSAPSRWTARSARPAPTCPGTPGAGAGGYTYGDFGKVIGGSRGARRRRDLGPDAVGPARRAGARTRHRDARHPGDGAVARPTRRSSTCATRSSRPTRRA